MLSGKDNVLLVQYGLSSGHSGSVCVHVCVFLFFLFFFFEDLWTILRTESSMHVAGIFLLCFYSLIT